MKKEWINCSDRLPEKEGYYKIKYEDGTEDMKPYRKRLSKNINGFMTISKVIQWK